MNHSNCFVKFHLTIYIRNCYAHGMSRNQFLFLFILALYVLGDFTAVSLTNLFLWQTTNDFFVVLIYNSLLFISMAVSGVGSSFLGGKIGTKKIFLLSMCFYALQILLLFMYAKTIASIFIFVGIVSGIALGSESYAYAVISQKITEGGNRERYLGVKTALLNIIILLGVPLLTYLATATHSYQPVFGIALTLLVLVCLIVPFLSVQEEKKPFRLTQVKQAIVLFPDLRSFLLAKFLFGLQNGLFWVLLGVVTLQFVGNLFVWGIVSSCLTLLFIVCSYFYGKSATLQSQKYSSVVGTFFFAISTLLLGTNWNFATFLIYQIVNVLLNVVLAISFETFMADIIEENEITKELSRELNGIGELAVDIGRFLPIIALFLLQFSITNTMYLRIVFIAVSSIPLLVINALKKTEVFSPEE